MNVAKLYDFHAASANAPRITSLLTSDPISSPRIFVGVGAPSSSTLPVGNGKYNGVDNGYVVSLTLASGGTGYVVGDTLTVGGTGASTSCQLVVDAVAAGVITDFHTTVVGIYTSYPSGAVAATGGTGSSATFNLVHPAPDMYVDNTTPTAPILYICKTKGSYSSSVWAQVSSAGGADTLCKIKSIQQYYITVNTWDGTTLGSTDINVAKTILCWPVSSETVDGNTVSYSSYGSDYTTRVATVGSDTEKQVINPRLRVGDLIYIKDVDHTLVTVSGSELKKIDANDARAWSRKYDQS